MEELQKVGLDVHFIPSNHLPLVLMILINHLFNPHYYLFALLYPQVPCPPAQSDGSDEPNRISWRSLSYLFSRTCLLSYILSSANRCPALQRKSDGNEEPNILSWRVDPAYYMYDQCECASVSELRGLFPTECK